MFHAHIEQIDFFLAHREAIVERIQGVLNAQRKPAALLQDRPLLARLFEDCFFIGLTAEQARLRGQLESAHWASGFRPRGIAGLHNGPIDPAEMMIRAFHLWQQTRWPGRNGRIRYAHTLFNLYVLGSLTLLTMRLWDDGPGTPADRLARLQRTLDRLWTAAPADQPVLVRDARWLIQLAQSPATDDLGAYFEVAARIAGSFSDEERLAVHAAGVHMTAGHLRSQIRYYCLKRSVGLDEPDLIRNSRNTNALDYALLIQDLVPLLAAYERACRSGDNPQRVRLAGAICQGVSPDPELFLDRVDLLGAYSMIEYLFIAADEDGTAAYTDMGRRHVALVEAYAAAIRRNVRGLLDDCVRFRPVPGTYSPYGVLYGFSSNLIEHMAFKTLQPDAITRFGFEDVFTEGDASSGKLAWVTGWRRLPHLKREVEAMFDYPQQFAEDVFNRVESTIRRIVAPEATLTPRTGRLFIATGDSSSGSAAAAAVPELAAPFVTTSDRQRVAAQRADYRTEAQIAADRREGRCVLSYRTEGGWIAISKGILTEVLGTGDDAKVVGLPRAAAGVLTLMCPGLVVAGDTPASAS